MSESDAVKPELKYYKPLKAILTVPVIEYITRLQTELDEAHNSMQLAHAGEMKAHLRREQAETKVTELVECLEFYADESHHRVAEYGKSVVMEDKGKRARDTLANIDKAGGEQLVQRYRDALEEIREIYADMDGFIPETAPEGYQQRIIKQMWEVTKQALANIDKPNSGEQEKEYE